MSCVDPLQQEIEKERRCSRHAAATTHSPTTNCLLTRVLIQSQYVTTIIRSYGDGGNHGIMRPSFFFLFIFLFQKRRKFFYIQLTVRSIMVRVISDFCGVLQLKHGISSSPNTNTKSPTRGCHTCHRHVSSLQRFFKSKFFET